MDMSQESFYARIYRKNAAPQDCDAQFVRACAIETHIDMSQEPFRARISKKISAPQGCDAQDCAGLRPALSKRTWTCHRGNFMREFTGKVPRPKIATHSMCERAQSNCRWASLKSHSMREFTGNMPPQKLGAGFVREGHLARAILCENLQECRTLEAILCKNLL